MEVINFGEREMEGNETEENYQETLLVSATFFF